MSIKQKLMSAAMAGAVLLPAVGAFASGNTITAPTLTFPTGFDAPTMLNMVVTQNASFILGGVGFVSMLWILGRVIKGLRGNAGRIAGR